MRRPGGGRWEGVSGVQSGRRTPDGQEVVVAVSGMYVSHFGLAERPFSIAPDPRFLFLSARHREALAHLLYGVGEEGGFVQLTGEVGTGKTTVCRHLLGQLPADVDVALILNHRMTALELMATVCDELRVPYPAGATSVKVLIDALYGHLLDAHARGRRTVLIIDEAQNLGGDVLEQIRLLTNLETTREKLLQVILVGQPELAQLLDRKELRQLAQRVTARYHLLPFTKPETCAYVMHRLSVAGQPGQIFEPRALQEVHRLSRGIPRLINIICDRALLGAYATDAHRIDAAMVRRASREVFGEARRPGFRWRWRWTLVAGGLLLVTAGGAAWLIADPRRALGRSQEGAEHRPAVTADGGAAPRRAADGVVTMVKAADANGAAGSAAPATLDRADAVGAAPALVGLFEDRGLESTQASAFASLYALWKVDYRSAGGAPPCEVGRAAGLSCLTRRGTWKVLRRFNLPAVVELMTAAGVKHYATVTAIDEQTATLEFGPRRLTLPLSEIDQFWDGAFVLVWKPPALGKIPISPGSRGKDVAWLRRQLGDGAGAHATDVYDDELRSRVATFQREHALIPDGIVGEETLARLVASRTAGVPSLGPARP